MSLAPVSSPDLAPELSALREELALAKSQLEGLAAENKLLRQKIHKLLQRFFGHSKNESLDPSQLLLLLAGLTDTVPAASAAPAPTPAPRAQTSVRPPARSGIPDDLPVQETVLLPEEVKANPEAFRQIDQVVTKELDWEPAHFFWRHYIRPKFVRKDPAAVPAPAAASAPALRAVVAAPDLLSRIDPREVLIATLPNRLIEKGLPGVGLLVHVLLSRFEDHLPYYRLEKIFLHRHRVRLSRQTLVDWTEQMATWLQPIYRQMKVELLAGQYLQVDETPIAYLDREEPGRSCQGFFWVYSRPGGNVLFDWQTSRGREGPDAFLKEFRGKLQSDGYRLYASLIQERNAPLLAQGKDPELVGFSCWAHARRKFHEAKDHDRRAGWVLHQIGLLYGLEKRLRKQGAAWPLRQAARAAEAGMILARLKTGLDRISPKVLPQSLLGQAVQYTLNLWPALTRYVEHGEVEIDSNAVENAIRPTAIGKKNFLFIGHPQAGWRSAVLYSIMASCHRYQLNPSQYLKDVLSRLPDLKQSEVPQITPAAWAKTHPQVRAPRAK